MTTAGRFPLICGMPVPRAFSLEAVHSAINYKPKLGDIFVVTYPKCGTTWLQTIILLILRKGKPSNDPLDMFFGCCHLELLGAEGLDITPKPLVIKTHLPYHLAPVSKEAKYVYVCRNMMDCAVSFYYHSRSLQIPITFEQFLDAFLSGDVPHGDYLDHLINWYAHKDDPNILFVTYEDLKKDPREEILKVAKFLKEEYWELLVNEPKILDDIIHFSSFDYMKKDINKAMCQLWNGEMDLGDRDTSAGFKKFLENRKKQMVSKISESNFLRKGIVGDWKNHFDSEQKNRFEEHIAKKTENCDVMNLWK